MKGVFSEKRERQTRRAETHPPGRADCWGLAAGRTQDWGSPAGSPPALARTWPHCSTAGSAPAAPLETADGSVTQ